MKMKEIFKKQLEFQKLLKNVIQSQEYRNQMFLGLFEESVELMKETPFKKHKNNQTFNEQNFLEECVDLQLYLINLVISVTDYETFKRKLKEKQKINFDRQKNGY